MIGILLFMVVMYVFSGNGCLWCGVVVRLEEQGADASDSLLLCRCDWLANVNNCNVLSLPRRVKPNLEVSLPLIKIPCY